MRELKGNWKDILASFKIAFDPAKVVLAFAGVVLTVIGVLIIKALVNHAGFLVILGVIVAAGLITYFCFKEKGDRTRLYIWVGGIAAAIILGIIFKASEKLYAAVPFLAGGFWLLIVWSFCGGAITRIASVEIASDERIGLKNAVKFALKKYPAFIWSPLVPILGILFLAFLIILAGLLCYIPWIGPGILALIFFPLMLLAGFVIFVVAIGGVLGFQLMFPAIGAEASDAFDAISRAYSYIFSQPWRWLYYNVVAVVYAALVMLLVKIFASNIIFITARCASVWWGRFDPIWKGALYYLNSLFRVINSVTGIPLSWYERLDPNLDAFIFKDIYHFWKTAAYIEPATVAKPSLGWTEWLGVFWISVFLWLFVCLAASYVVSLAGSLQTLIYFLMRKHVDGTEMTEVNTEETEILEKKLFEEEEEVPARPAPVERGEPEKKEELPPIDLAEGPEGKPAEGPKPEEKAEGGQPKPKRRRGRPPKRKSE